MNIRRYPHTILMVLFAVLVAGCSADFAGPPQLAEETPEPITVELQQGDPFDRLLPFDEHLGLLRIPPFEVPQGLEFTRIFRRHFAPFVPTGNGLVAVVVMDGDDPQCSVNGNTATQGDLDAYVDCRQEASIGATSCVEEYYYGGPNDGDVHYHCEYPESLIGE